MFNLIHVEEKFACKKTFFYDLSFFLLNSKFSTSYFDIMVTDD